MVLVLFDGDCHFCNYWVRFILPRDRRKVFRFAPLALVPELNQDSIVVRTEGEFFYKSEAVFRILENLGVPSFATSLFRKIPRPLRDGVYDFIAARRYLISWLMNFQSRGDFCALPSPIERQQFIYNQAELQNITQKWIS